jgi:hypothetical protein
MLEARFGQTFAKTCPSCRKQQLQNKIAAPAAACIVKIDAGWKKNLGLASRELVPNRKRQEDQAGPE